VDVKAIKVLSFCKIQKNSKLAIRIS